MLTISPIRNVKSTINNISFGSGVQSNNRATDVINNTAGVKHDGGFLTDFLGTIQQSPLFYEKLFQRQASIEKGLNLEENKIDAIA